ncbi:DUF1127 domain-containing protein [Radicibacter daui]|uniref:DUF1127 domain-containing protein n=1 Tax=Radicibacter daui TaxID=3064829 RepID=UPI00404699E9
MSAPSSAVLHPVRRRSLPALLLSGLAACWRLTRRYFARRAAIAHLQELESYCLTDIGLERAQIEAAVRGVPLDIGRNRRR